ncbi:hypothetical protein N0V87_002438 [Didymella glomerata]|uniref:Uncharacterized protein n=1 Tax=Didymella glomerata TaxID=749621 RepID=A0A9W9C3K2_9PLEO|nr:hypothetical protein N0V87_002438 [Didymella glomerata]
MPVYTPIEDFVAQLPEPEDDPFFLDLVASLQPGVDQDISDNDNFFEDYLEPPAQAVWDELERGPFQGLLDQDTFSLGAYVHDEPAGNGSLDNLQAHLREAHDTRGRQKFADTLATRGYNFEHAEVICPLCPEASLFKCHEDFCEHFVVEHCPDVSERFIDIENFDEQGEMRMKEVFPSLFRGYGNGNTLRAMRECKVVTDEVRIHCRTILSLWPDFEDHPVWGSLKTC